MLLHLDGRSLLELHVLRDHLLESAGRMREELLLHLGDRVRLGYHALVGRTLRVLRERCTSRERRWVRFFSEHISFQ